MLGGSLDTQFRTAAKLARECRSPRHTGRSKGEGFDPSEKDRIPQEDSRMGQGGLGMLTIVMS
jgi:hypothetical protein